MCVTILKSLVAGSQVASFRSMLPPLQGGRVREGVCVMPAGRCADAGQPGAGGSARREDLDDVEHDVVASTCPRSSATAAPARPFGVKDVVVAASALRRALVDFDPVKTSVADCAEIAEALARTEKACAGARAGAACRAASGGAHRARGFADPADWMASRTGAVLGQARGEMEAAEAVLALPVTRSALAAGDVSLAQAAEVARAEAAVPGSEGCLLELARSSSLGAVRERAKKIILGAADPAELALRRHRARSFRHWRDELGMVRFAGAVTPENGMGLMERLDAEAQRLRRAGTGDREAFEAYAADAFVSMLEGTALGRGHTKDLHVVVDLRAYRRGHPHPGEPCHMGDGTPVTVDWVRDNCRDAFVKAALHDGTEIRTVAHLGRHLPAELRTALELGCPPDFEGAECAVAGCCRKYGLEWDHVNPVANSGPTSFDNLQALCKPHHWEKTERDRESGLLGPRAP